MALIFKSAEETAKNPTTLMKKVVVDAHLFLGISNENAPYYKEKEDFATTFNSMNNKEQKYFEQFLLLTKGGYPITNFLDEKVDQNGNPYYWLKFDKFGGARVEAKVVLDDAIRQLVNDIHDGKVKVNFTLDDLKVFFDQ